MPGLNVSKDQILARTAFFRDLEPSSLPLIDAVLPEYSRELFNIIGRGVCEDAGMKVPITAVEGFHMTLIKCGPGKGTGLHSHKTVEVFMPLSGRWSIIWGDEGENALVLDPWDVISVPTEIMRGFRNESDDTAYLLAILGGSDPGKVSWAPQVLEAARRMGKGLDPNGNIIEVSAA
jgi:uncharacterized RmlC-like cupin family protein